ncbi:MAG TPA: glycosyltransferase [Trebonia sp.]|jgi:dolichol-phosphate mannosyltransferase
MSIRNVLKIIELQYEKMAMCRAINAGAEFVVQMDSDLSHRPEYLPGMLGTLLSADADAVIGSRYVAGASVGVEWPWYRKLLSGFANSYVRRFSTWASEM